MRLRKLAPELLMIGSGGDGDGCKTNTMITFYSPPQARSVPHAEIARCHELTLQAPWTPIGSTSARCQALLLPKMTKSSRSAPHASAVVADSRKISSDPSTIPIGPARPHRVMPCASGTLRVESEHSSSLSGVAAAENDEVLVISATRICCRRRHQDYQLVPLHMPDRCRTPTSRNAMRFQHPGGLS